MKNTDTLQKNIRYFINERIEEIEEYRENEYNLKSIEIIKIIEQSLGRDHNIYNIIRELLDLHSCEIVDMMEITYRLGFKDGFNFEKAMFDI